MPALPGFRDFLPENWAKQAYIFQKFRENAEKFGFSEFSGPPLEPLELYTKKSGEEIVGQLYHFRDKGNRDVALRPELTPTLARLAAEHQRQYKKPLKWYSIPQLFRYERQQKGRLREHFQFNADILGISNAAADAELIALLIETLRSFGLNSKDFTVRLSHRGIWHDFLKNCGILPENYRKTLEILDKIERNPPEKTKNLLLEAGFSEKSLENLLDLLKIHDVSALPESEFRQYLCELFQDLVALGCADYFRLDLKIVRGLAYYTGTVFEAFALDAAGNFTGRAIAGGGRYDDLVKNLAGVELPAAGFGMGDVVLADLLDEKGLFPASFAKKTLIFCWSEGFLRKIALETAAKIRRETSLRIIYPLRELSLGKQLQFAQEHGATAVVIFKSEQDVVVKEFSDSRNKEFETAVQICDLQKILSNRFSLAVG